MDQPKEHVTLEDYLSSEVEEGKIEFRIVARRVESGMQIYIHPLGMDGDSRDFVITENTTQDVTRWLPEPSVS